MNMHPSEDQIADSARPGLKVTREESETGDLLLRVAGELDLAGCELVEAEHDAILAAGGAVAIDLRECTFIDSSGLRSLLILAQAAEEGGISFSVVRGPKPVERVFELTGAGEILNLVDAP